VPASWCIETTIVDGAWSIIPGHRYCSGLLVATAFLFCVTFSALRPTQDHITLLLSCYTKVKDEGQINALLDAIAVNPHIRGANKGNTLKNTHVTLDGSGNFSQFNPEQAIHILDTAGYTGKLMECCIR
jgi:hypothetical protein